LQLAHLFAKVTWPLWPGGSKMTFSGIRIKV